MILTGSEDIRVRKTITSIRSAFCEMICGMDYEDMTVKELCERALINKKTFYVYYETLDDLLREVQESYSASYIREIGEIKLPEDIGRLIRRFFEFSARQDEAYEKITCAASYHAIRGAMISKVIGQTLISGGSDLLAPAAEIPSVSPGFSPFQNRITYRFWTETVLMIYTEWIREGKHTPLEDVIDYATGLILNGIDDFIIKKA